MATCQAVRTVNARFADAGSSPEAEKRLISRGRKLLNQIELQRWLATRWQR